MIRLGLRLTLAGGREAAGRLVLIVVAVAVGVGLLLVTLSGMNAVRTQNDRYAWLETHAAGSRAAGTADPLFWRLRADYFHGTVIGRVDLAGTGPRSPVPPGIARLPGPGQYYASPALAALLRHTPAAQLGARYPGTEIGTIGDAALPSPDSLLIVIGHSPAQLAGQHGVDRVTSISTTSPAQCAADGCAVGVGVNKNGLILILSVVTAALLFPVLVLIGGATRLSAARREQRFAAMRLCGATPAQIARIATVESTVATVIGVAGGFALFFAIRPAVAQIPFTGERFFTGDLALTLLDVLLVALGVPVIAGFAARLALRRVNLSPLGVTRRVTPKPPSPWRLVPVLAGAAELGYFAYVHNIGANTRTSPTVEAVVFLAGVLLLMAGLVIAGPWLTMLAARVAVRRARRPATLIAARRLADDPRAGFRAVSGLVLAVFVGSCATAIITALVANGGGGTNVDARLTHLLIDSFGPDEHRDATAAVPVGRLTAVPGVTGVAVLRDHQLPTPAGAPPTRDLPPVEEVVSCRDLAAMPALGRCAPGASVVSVTPNFGADVIDALRRTSMPDTTWGPALVAPAKLARLPVDTIVVGTDGSTAAIERARTVLDLTYGNTFAAQTVSEIHADRNRLLDDYRRLAEVVILTSLPIAGCSLAVSIAGGLAERKRPFSLLRLTGVPLRMLRRVIALEAAAPLFVSAVVSVGVGLLGAQLFLRAQLGARLQPLGMAFYGVVAAGLLAALALVASTLPLLRRLTGPEVARND